MLRHLSRSRAALAIRMALVCAQVGSAVPITVIAAQQDVPQDQSPAPSSEPVEANRAVPVVAAPPTTPTFSPQPTVAEIFQAHAFPEPLVPIGGLPTREENAALARAIVAYHARADLRWIAPFQVFQQTYPQSPWRASLLVNVAGRLREAGAFSSAIETADAAWELTKDATDSNGRAVADLAAAESIEIAAMFGQTDAVRARSEALATRNLRGPAATRVNRARETAAMVEEHPERIIASGPEALRNLLELRDGTDAPVPAVLKSFVPTAAGVSLAELSEMARRAGLAVRVARRTGQPEIPVPSVVHWALGHYSAVVERRGTEYRVLDIALGGSRWVDEDTLQNESSGYWLIPNGTSGEGWADVTGAEAASVIGHSCPPGGPPPSPPTPDEPCPPGMPVYYFNQVNAALVLADQPTTYRPPVGPDVAFRLTYNQREVDQPQIFTYANLGPMWALRWIRFVQEEPQCSSGQCDSTLAWVQLERGGREVYEGRNVAGVYVTHWFSKAILVRTSNAPARYERRLPDGSLEVYAQSDSAPEGQRRIFLTQIVDPQGLAVTLTWDAQFRLVAVTDAVGLVSTLAYGLAADPLKITAVTDPYGRTATFSYTVNGQLASVTDTLGLSSRFTYQDEDFVTAMTTPYGTTTFRHEWDPVNMYIVRFIEATDPLGATEHAEFLYDSGIAATAPASEVPTGFEAWNVDLDGPSTFYWDKQAWSLWANDVSKATITRWMTKPDWSAATEYSTPLPHSIKRPLEGRIWFKYENASSASPFALGQFQAPVAIARRLDDGQSQVWQRTYNALGHLLTEVDPAGRRTSYTYAANEIDLMQVVQTTGTLNDVLATFGNYNQHRYQLAVDQAGQTTTILRNTAGQVVSVTNPKLETVTLTYDTDGRLLAFAGPVSGAGLTFTYDTYGRLRTRTDVGDAYTTVTDYDIFDRAIRVTYADATYDAYTYERLDRATTRDRLGRTTRFYYDALRRVISVRDPAGRVERQEWCTCGKPSKLVDANNHATTWEHDLEARVTRELRADAVTATSYDYETLSGRLLSVTDPLGQVTTKTYDVADAVVSVTYTNATVATPSVSFTYDPLYPRPVVRVDGIGTTAYSYRAPGELGAGQIATIDGPFANDTITFAYDELGRTATRTLNGASVTRTYDALGRIVGEENPLGTFSYLYDGVSPRVATAIYPNGQTSLYSYFDNSDDRRLQSIHHKREDGSTLLRVDYAYDVVGTIRSLQAQIGDSETTTWAYTYDPVNQLISATHRVNDPSATILSTYAYHYDPAGNRTTEQVNDAVTGATYDALNRMATKSATGLLRVAGTVNEPATVRIDGIEAVVSPIGDFVGTTAIADGTNALTVSATDAAGNSTAALYHISSTGEARAFTYDANGNLTTDGIRSFEWDAKNQLVAISVGTHRSEFAYDGDRHRVRAIELEGGVVELTTETIWCQDAICEERDVTSPASIRRSFSQGEQVGGESRYFVGDGLGSLNAVTDVTGAVLARYSFDPWGKRTVTAGTDITNRGYAGQRWDSISNLSLTMYRAYDPESGRWISEDPAGRVDGQNLYIYAVNEPTGRVDPLGDKSCCSCSVQVNCRSVGGVVGYLADHCYIVAKDAQCKTWYIESGPSGPNGTGLNVPTPPSDTLSSGNRGVSTLEGLRSDSNCRDVDCMKKAWQYWNDAKIAYGRLGPNSNSFASWILRECGSTAVRPIGAVAIGWY